MSDGRNTYNKVFKNPYNTRGEIIGRDKWDNILVDTCLANDTGKYETYVSKGEDSAIVEIYPNRESAIKGHKKWVKLMKKNPNRKIEDKGFEEWIGIK